jgi:hypothetical protein
MSVAFEQQVAHGGAFGFKGAIDGVMNQRSAQGPHMCPAGGSLRIIDRLRSLELFCKLIAPKHIRAKLSRFRG